MNIHNDHDRPVQLLLEPSGHCFEMPPGSMFDVRPQRREQLEIRQLGTDLMVVGFVAKVIHDGEVLASWDEPPGGESNASKTGRIAGPDDIRWHLSESGEQIMAMPDGAMISRRIGGRMWVVRVQWRESQQHVQVSAPLGFDAPLERERDLALTITRIHVDNGIPGFQLLRSESAPVLDLKYWLVVFFDEEDKVATTVLDRSIAVCFDMVTRYADRLEAVARGKPDPDAA